MLKLNLCLHVLQYNLHVYPKYAFCLQGRASRQRRSNLSDERFEEREHHKSQLLEQEASLGDEDGQQMSSRSKTQLSNLHFVTSKSFASGESYSLTLLAAYRFLCQLQEMTSSQTIPTM